MKDRIARYQEEASASASATISRSLIKDDGEVLVELNDVNVSYHERKVSISGFFVDNEAKFCRCSKTRTGGCERAKGGTSRDQTVCPKRVRIYF